ncbi:hypothetical protein Scep_007292 [Stephania cephalantha]|uniref:4a-hydroxytetrahydrobiopterin dehydratase n=1 Tax=Stephania cephalantha TaxID=152367 RepID=A0AAP0KAU9_9MAGN
MSLSSPMALTHHQLCRFTPLPLLSSSPKHHNRHSSLKTSTTNNGAPKQLMIKASSSMPSPNDYFGDFGARDPFPAELESNFADKVVGNVSTEHKILIPTLSVLSLAQQDCSPISPSLPPISEEDAQKLLKKIIGWRLVDDQGTLKLQCLWKLRDFKCSVELINRVSVVVDDAGHYPNLFLEQPNQVRAELWTTSIGGLSMNDFIVAAKIDEAKTSDLVPKKRIWA